MVIEVKVNVIREITTRKSKLRNERLKLGGKLTIEGQRHWIHLVKTKNDDKWKYVEAMDHSNRAENGLGPARNETGSHPICSGKGMV